MTSQRDNARQAGGPDRASNAVKSAHSQAQNVAHAGVVRIATCGLPLPRPDGCKGQLLASLMRQPEGVTHRTFDMGARTMRTAVYIDRLRKDGWDIETLMCSGQNNYEKVRYALYRLKPIKMGEAEKHFLMACQLVEMGVW